MFSKPELQPNVAESTQLSSPSTNLFQTSDATSTQAWQTAEETVKLTSNDAWNDENNVQSAAIDENGELNQDGTENDNFQTFENNDGSYIADDNNETGETNEAWNSVDEDEADESANEDNNVDQLDTAVESNQDNPETEIVQEQITENPSANEEEGQWDTATDGQQQGWEDGGANAVNNPENDTNEEWGTNPDGNAILNENVTDNASDAWGTLPNEIPNNQNENNNVQEMATFADESQLNQVFNNGEIEIAANSSEDWNVSPIENNNQNWETANETQEEEQPEQLREDENDKGAEEIVQEAHDVSDVSRKVSEWSMKSQEVVDFYCDDDALNGGPNTQLHSIQDEGDGLGELSNGGDRSRYPPHPMLHDQGTYIADAFRNSFYDFHIES